MPETTREEIRRFEDYVQAASLGARRAREARTESPTALASSGRNDPVLDKLLAEVENAVSDVGHSMAAPVRIGVVGRFNAGKTTLLGALVGNAGGLPINSVATTGNVTVLRFRPVDDLRTTEFGPYEIDFLDMADLRKCLKFMLEAAKQRVREASAPSETRRALDQIDVESPAVWDDVETWCRKAWQESAHPGVRWLVRELVQFVRAFKACGQAFCLRPRPYQVSLDIARKGLTLGPMPNNLQTMSFNELPPEPPRIPTAPKELGVEDLQKAFPLIRRVTIDVTLSRQIWPVFEETGASKFELLDFPGLGAANSGIRDQYLYECEVPSIQTILILLNASDPGDDSSLEVFNKMTRDDARLVAVSLFDKLPLMTEHLETLRELAGEDDFDLRAPVTERDAQKRLEPLQAVVAWAQALKADWTNVVFLSPLLGLVEQAERLGGAMVGTPEFRQRLFEDAASALRIRGPWRRLAHRIKAAEPQSQLAEKLEDFADDGGISRLRELIVRHVAHHGEAQRRETIIRKVDRLSRTIAQLRERLQELAALESKRAAVPAPPRSAPGIGLNRLEAIRSALSKVAQRYGEWVAHFKDDPPSLAALDDLTGASVKVGDLVRAETIARISRWEEWYTLLSQSQDGYLLEKAPQNQQIMVVRVKTQSIPTTSDHFFKPFQASVAGLEEFARGKLEKAIRGWFDSLSNELASARQTLAAFLNLERTLETAADLGMSEDFQDALFNVAIAIAPERMTENFVQGCLNPASSNPTGDGEEREPGADSTADAPRIDARALFPLPLSDSSGKGGRWFAWRRSLQEKPLAERPDRYHRHQSQIHRLRSEFIRCASQRLSQWVGEVEKQLGKDAVVNFDVINKQLQERIYDSEFLDWLLRIEDRGRPASVSLDKEGAGDGIGDPRKPASSSADDSAIRALWDLASLRSPLEAAVAN